jgi:hypothetical protein
VRRRSRRRAGPDARLDGKRESEDAVTDCDQHGMDWQQVSAE